MGTASRPSLARLQGCAGLQVRGEALAAALAAVAGLLVAAERRRRVEAVEGVRPDHAGAQLVGDGEDLRPLVAPDARRQAVRRVVRLGDRLGRRAEGQHRQHRPEDLLARDPRRGRHVVEDRRREPEAVLGDDARRRPALGTLGLADVAELADAVQLLAGVDRPDVGVLVERVAEPQRREPRLQPVDDLLVDALLHQQPRSGAADVPLVEEDAVDDALDGLVDRRVVEDDVRGLAAELEGDLLAGSGDRLGDLATHGGRPGERDLVDVRMPHQRRARLAGAGDDVDDPVRELGLLHDLGEQQRGQRGGLGGLQHDGVARGERRGDLPGEHEQREVPRDDLRGDAERARVRAEPGVVELVGPARVVEEPGGDERHVDVAALLDRLAVVEALGDRQLAGALLHEPRDAEQVLAAVGPAELRPGLVVGAAGGGDGGIHVFGRRGGDLGDVLLGGRRDAGERLAVPGARMRRR